MERTGCIDYAGEPRSSAPKSPGGAGLMIRGIYSAATAMDAAAKRHELIAQNLAHLSMPGYRRVMLPQQTFESTLDSSGGAGSGYDSLGTASMNPVVDFSPGPMESTGNASDLAIVGDGFFVVDAAGETLYTRNGTFIADLNGQITTMDGFPVQGESGPITLPEDASITSLRVGPDGTATVDGEEIGRFRVVQFADQSVLAPAGVTLFRAAGGVTPEDSSATVVQGSRERSNVHPVLELVEMIAASRAHEAAQKAMSAIADAVQKHTDA